jgi:hypothetical protein
LLWLKFLVQLNWLLKKLLLKLLLFLPKARLLLHQLLLLHRLLVHPLQMLRRRREARSNFDYSSHKKTRHKPGFFCFTLFLSVSLFKKWFPFFFR